MQTMVKAVKCKLVPTPQQADDLCRTLEAFANACNRALAAAKETGKKRQFDLHHACYHAIRQATGLTANYVVRAIARVAASFGKGMKPAAQFKPTSLDLDKDLFRYYPAVEIVSLATINGRRKIRLALGEYQRRLLAGQKPKAGTLNFDGKRFFLNLCIEMPEPEPGGTDPLGVDLGIKRIATTSDGEIRSGRRVNRVRERYGRTRATLQRKHSTEDTRGNSWRVLKRLRGRERRFVRTVNHRISRKLVDYAKAHRRMLVLENLSGIRQRASGTMLNHWAFYQLRKFISYKAAEAGVAVRFVSPAYTSQTCSGCGSRGLRRKHRFLCTSCGLLLDADLNAARNIAALGRSINTPEVTHPVRHHRSDKPLALAGGH